MRKIVVIALCCIMSSCVFVRANGESWGGRRIVGRGETQSKEYTVESFDEISMSIPADVYYVYSEEEPTVKVVAFENLHEYIEIAVKGCALEIKTAKNVSLVSSEDIKVYVNNNKLKKVSIAGSGDFENISPINGESFGISVAGSGNADIKNVEVSKFDATISGSGDIEIKNAVVKSFAVSIAGSGDFDVEGLVADKVEAAIAGSGDMKFEGKALEGSFSVAGSGDIDIRNFEIEHYNMKTSGTGSIHK